MATITYKLSSRPLDQLRNHNANDPNNKNWFSELPLHVQSALEDASVIQGYVRGDVVFVEGERPTGVYFLRIGRVRLSTTAADGKILIVCKAGPGDVIGLPGVVDGKPSEVTAEVVSCLECQFVPREAFLKIIREHPDGALQTAAILTHIYRTALGQMRYLGLSTSTAEKIARFLLDLPSGDGAKLDTAVRITHKEIAAAIGASRETVTRMLARFRRKQLVHSKGSQLRVVNRDGLKRVLTRMDDTFGVP